MCAHDDPMIVGETKVHHGPDDDLPLPRYRRFHDLAHPENRALRLMNDRRCQKCSINTGIGEGDRTALYVLQRELSFPRFGR